MLTNEDLIDIIKFKNFSLSIIVQKKVGDLSEFSYLLWNY